MRTFFVGLGLMTTFVAGCIAALMQLVVPPVRAGTNPTRWEYQCISEVEKPWKGEGATKLNAMGAQGWELVLQHHPVPGAVGIGYYDVWCFKRALP